MTEEFFDEPEDQSLVKADIVVTYFDAWAGIMARRAPEIRYVDLYSGPGKYTSGEASTPLQLLNRALRSATYRSKLAAIFNDGSSAHADALRSNIAGLAGVGSLATAPIVRNEVVTDDLVDSLFSRSSAPTLTFLDPWGYKGLTRPVIRKVISGFGCEAIFFFNYRRINAAVDNDLFEAHMAALFASDRLSLLRQQLTSLEPRQREMRLMRSLGDTLQELGAKYLIPFRFQAGSVRTSHYICFVTKHRLGYEIMKEVMAKRGDVDVDGVPAFAYLPPTQGVQLGFGIDRPIQDLAADLLTRYAGRTLRVREIFSDHNVGRPFILRNYKRVLIELEKAGRIACAPDRRRANTMADDVHVTFPSS